MKRKILMISLVAVAFCCLLAISVSAENKVIKLDTLPTLAQIHENPEAYVSHLNGFDESSYKERDGESVVVMSDLAETPSYYVFPAFYVLERTSHNPNVTKLNTFLAEAGAFSSFAATGGRGGNKHIIRIEIPTYVTTLDGWNKFEGASNLKEVYFPTKIVVDEETGEEKEVTCVTTIGGANTFTGCNNLETVHNFDKLPLTIYNGGAFSGCYKLTGITLHQGIKSIPSGMFCECRALNNLVFPEGLEEIGTSAFENCNAMTEIILPNSVTTIGKKTFAYMDNLETISFGAGLYKLVSSDENLELLDGCPNLKYVYMPACFATEVQKSGHGILRTGTNVTFFFTGTIKQAEAIREKLPAGGNPLIAGAEFLSYDPNIDYTNYAQTLGKTIFVCNYSACEAFYNGNHDVAEEYTLEYAGERFLSVATKSKACSKCIFKVDKTELAPLFACLGYSTNGEGNVIQGFQIDQSVIAEYESVLGTVEYGVIAAVDKRNEQEDDITVGVELFGLDKYICFNLSDSLYNFFTIKINGITEEKYDTGLFFCAYITFGDSVYYVNNGVCDTVATSTKYSQIVE